MDIQKSLLAALNASLKYEPSLNPLRLNHLNSWFSEDNCEKFQSFYNSLGDDESKLLLLKILHNNLGVFLAGDREEFRFFSSREWEGYKKRAAAFPGAIPSYSLDIMETFILEGYNYRNLCAVEPGDIVLDCGAFTGNTALYFSEKVGNEGRIFSFEPIDKTYRQLLRNIKEAPNNNISPVQAAVSSKTGKVYFMEKNAASKVVEGTGIEHDAIAIDDFVASHKLDRVDFIKMDVEGSEKSALDGAKQTIAKFLPKLAICIYHLCDDYITIPEKILAINPNYTFYLKHNDVGFSETVLFAFPQKKLDSSPPDSARAQLNHNLWESIKALQISRQKERRRRLLENYNHLIMSKLPFLGSSVFGANFAYLYYPVSDDSKLHYELLFHKNGIEISLHLEGNLDKKRELVEELASASRISIPLSISQKPGKGVSYYFRNIDDAQKVVDLLIYLIDLSLPILIRENLVSDKILLSMPSLLRTDK